MVANFVFSFTTAAGNRAPTDISLSPNSIDENEPPGTLVGVLTATDPDASQTHSFSLVGYLRRWARFGQPIRSRSPVPT